MKNVIHFQEKRQTIQMLELASKDFKAAIATMLNGIKENMNKNPGKHGRRKESIKMEIQKLKIIIY